MTPPDPPTRGRSNPARVQAISPLWAGQEIISLECIKEDLTLAPSLNVSTNERSLSTEKIAWETVQSVA